MSAAGLTGQRIFGFQGSEERPAQDGRGRDGRFLHSGLSVDQRDIKGPCTPLNETTRGMANDEFFDDEARSHIHQRFPWRGRG